MKGAKRRLIRRSFTPKPEPGGRIREALKPFAQHHAFIDEWSKRTPKEMLDNSPCEKGCWYCCMQLVIVTIPEALYMLAGLFYDEQERAWLGSILPELRKQIELVTQPGMSNVEWFKREIRCLFLTEDNLCRIYERRPGVCRAYRVIEGHRVQCTLPLLKVKCLDTGLIEEQTAKVATRVAQDFKIRPYPMPLPLSLHFAIVGLTEGLGEMRERLRNGRRMQAEWQEDGTVVTNKAEASDG